MLSSDPLNTISNERWLSKKPTDATSGNEVVADSYTITPFEWRSPKEMAALENLFLRHNVDVVPTLGSLRYDPIRSRLSRRLRNLSQEQRQENDLSIPCGLFRKFYDTEFLEGLQQRDIVLYQNLNIKAE